MINKKHNLMVMAVAAAILLLTLLSCFLYTVFERKLSAAQTELYDAYFALQGVLDERDELAKDVLDLVNVRLREENELTVFLNDNINAALSSLSISQRIDAENKISEGFGEFRLKAGQKTNLQKNKTYLKLLARLDESDSTLAGQMQLYNEQCALYNALVSKFPYVLFGAEPVPSLQDPASFITVLPSSPPQSTDPAAK